MAPDPPTEHLDVLIVGAGLSGIGAAHHLQERCPARATRSSRRGETSAAPGTCSATPASARTPTCTRSATGSGRGRRRSRSPTAPRSSNYVRETAREAGIDRTDPLPPPRGVGASGRRRGAAGRWRRSAPTRGRPSASPAASSSSAAATTATTRATRREFAGDRALRRADHPPPALARGPRLRRQAGGGDRQRRHRDDAGAGDGGERRPRDDAAALADLRRLDAGRRRDRQRAARGAPATGLAYPIVRWKNVLLQMAELPAQPPPPRLHARGSAAGLERRCRPATTSTPISSPSYNPWDQRLCLVPDGDLFKVLSDGRAEIVTDRIDDLHRGRDRARVGRASSRPTSSSPRPGSTCSSWAG